MKVTKLVGCMEVLKRTIQRSAFNYSRYRIDEYKDIKEEATKLADKIDTMDINDESLGDICNNQIFELYHRLRTMDSLNPDIPNKMDFKEELGNE